MYDKKRFDSDKEFREKRRKASREWHRRNPQWDREWKKNHPDKVKEYQTKTYKKNHEEILKRKAIYRLKNKEKIRQQRKKWKKTPYNPEKKKQYYNEKRMIVINHYGGKCSCCGISEPEFLNITGGKDKEKRGSHQTLQIIKKGFPEKYKILCANCTMAIKIYGVCPHERR